MRTFLDRAVVADSLDRLGRLQPNASRRWGKMNAAEMVCHLRDSFELALGEREASPVKGLLRGTVAKTFALRVPLPWPPNIPTRPEMDPQAAGTRPVEFEADRRRLIEVVNRFVRPDRDFSFGVHPAFGSMTEWEWMRWGYLHTDHHLRQFGL